MNTEIIKDKHIKSNYPKPSNKPLSGRYCVLYPFNIQQHVESLYQAFGLDIDGIDWTYLPYGPFATQNEFIAWLEKTCLGNDPFFYTINDSKHSKNVGMTSLLNIVTQHGSIEIGNVHFSPLLQQTVTATESFYLIMKFVFEELGYRRLEWKCDNANQRSKNCAARLGFTFEGIFRQHWVYKGRNRDTAWFSIIDKEWPNIKTRLENWLSPRNFNNRGKQIKKLSDF